jgi:hypothetical protein
VLSEQENAKNQAESSNNQMYTTATALHIRLDVSPLLNQLEMDIRGLKETWNEETQRLELVRISEPLFSREVGIQSFMSYIRGVINTQVVQGNLDEDSYSDYMASVHEGLATDLMINRKKYGLEIYHYQGVIRLAMNTVRGFLTRSLGNKERESYAHTMKHVEQSSTVQGRTGGIFNFKN